MNLEAKHHESVSSSKLKSAFPRKLSIDPLMKPDSSSDISHDDHIQSEVSDQLSLPDSALDQCATVKAKSDKTGKLNAEERFCAFNAETGKFHCTICQRKYKSMKCFRAHYRGIHLKIKAKLDCSDCGMKFNYDSLLRRHQENVPSRFKCQDCDKTFIYKRSLSLHWNVVHLKLQEHGCDACGKKFKKLKALRSHRRNAHLRLN